LAVGATIFWLGSNHGRHGAFEHGHEGGVERFGHDHHQWHEEHHHWPGKSHHGHDDDETTEHRFDEQRGFNDDVEAMPAIAVCSEFAPKEETNSVAKAPVKKEQNDSEFAAVDVISQGPADQGESAEGHVPQEGDDNDDEPKDAEHHGRRHRQGQEYEHPRHHHRFGGKRWEHHRRCFAMKIGGAFVVGGLAGAAVMHLVHKKRAARAAAAARGGEQSSKCCGSPAAVPASVPAETNESVTYA
jgi:hypothetical protein